MCVPQLSLLVALREFRSYRYALFCVNSGEFDEGWH